MTRFQKFILSLMPAAWAKAAEAESRTWMIRCVKCGHERSVWDAGGIRWGGGGNPHTFGRCSACKTLGWHKIVCETPAKGA